MTRPDRCRRCHGYDYGGHGAWCWYDRQASWQRAAERRETRARFGKPVGPLGKKTPTPDRVVNFEAQDREDIPLGRGDCPECGEHVPLYSDHMRGWRGPLCGCGWRGKRIDYREAV